MIAPAKIQVRFSDCDLLGHVNNAVYLNYFETARMHYFGMILGEKWDWKKMGVILLKNIVEYKSPVFLEDKPVITIKTKDIGNKSFTLSYSLMVGDEERTIGESVMVCFDFESNNSISIPMPMLNALNNL